MDGKPTDSPEKGKAAEQKVPLLVHESIDAHGKAYRERSPEPDVSGEISRMLDSARHRTTTEPGSFLRQIYSDPDFTQPPSAIHIEDGASAHRCRDFPHMHHMMSLKVPGGGASKGSKSPKPSKKSSKGHKHKHKPKVPKEKVETYQPSLPQLDESPPKDEPDAKFAGDAKYVDTGQVETSAATPEVEAALPDVAIIMPDDALQPEGVTLPIEGETMTDYPESEPIVEDHTTAVEGGKPPMSTLHDAGEQPEVYAPDMDIPTVAFEQPTDELPVDHKPPKADFYIGADDVEIKEKPAPFNRLLSTEEEPMRSPRPGIHGESEVEASDMEDHRERKPGGVTFLLGEDHEDSDQDEQVAADRPAYDSTERRDSLGREKHSVKKRKLRSKHVPSEKDLLSRRRKGSEIALGRGMKRVPTEKEEALTLSGVDLDDMASHRFEHMRSMSRPMLAKHSALASIVHLSQADKPKKMPKYDHSPHEMFVELEELHVGENREWQWTETARWIKFEEDVEQGSNRWGKPHVASLSFHSLLELRRCIEQGAVLLDLEQPDFPSVVNAIADELVFKEQISIDEKGTVMKALLVKHSHVTETKDIIRRNMSYLNLRQFDSARLHQHSHSSEGLHLLRGSLKRGASDMFRKNTSFPSHPLGSQNAQEGDSLENHNKKHIKIEVEPMKKNGEPVSDETGSSKQTQIFSSHPELGGRKRSKTSESSPGLERKSSVVKESKRAESMPAIADGVQPVSDTHSSGREAFQFQKSVLRRIPEGAEATSVLVGTVDFLKMPAMAFVRLSEGRNLGNLTEVPLPVRFLFVLLGPSDGHMDYHEIGRSISTLMANTMFHDVAYKAEGRQDLLDAINEFLDDSMVLPPGDWDRKTLLPVLEMAKKARLRKQNKKKAELQPLIEEAPKPPWDPLQRSRKLFGGLIMEVKKRYPLYLSDIKDGLNVQCLATFFFIYFACLSPAITFGGLLGEKTDNWMGASETLLVTCIGGLVMSFLSAQPLTIVGVTGPIVLFEESMFQISGQIGVEFLPFRLWVGLWVTVIGMLVVMFEGSFLVRFITRFTEEIFAFLISLIFIYEVFNKLYVIFTQHPLPYILPPCNVNGTDGLAGNVSMDNFTVWNISAGVNATAGTIPDPVTRDKLNQPNTALLSVILTFGTFLIAWFLKQLRNSQFFGRTARRALGDFGIPIAIVIMVLVDFLIKDTYTQKLFVPEGLQPTEAGKRGWFINPLGLERPLAVGYIFAAAIPALLVFILIFMETEITSVIVNKSERRLQKGSGYHTDLLLVSCFASLCGLCGLPFLTAATVRSVTHTSALSVFSKTHAPGDKPKLVEVKEQRLTGFAVHVMIGVSVLMGKVLKQVPLAVLFGVFLYMGVSSLSGIQLVERIELMLKPVKHYPERGYTKRVRTWKMHLYTFIQLIMLGVLWAVKSTKAALSFPFFLIMLVPLRAYFLKLFFNYNELHELDKQDEDVEDEDDEDEPDFYTQAHMPW